MPVIYAGNQDAVGHGVRNERAEDADWHGDLHEAHGEIEIDHAAPVVANKPRQEPERLREQRCADRGKRGREHVLGAQYRKEQHENRCEQGRPANAAEHSGCGYTYGDGKHEPVQGQIQNACAT